MTLNELEWNMVSCTRDLGLYVEYVRYCTFSEHFRVVSPRYVCFAASVDQSANLLWCHWSFNSQWRLFILQHQCYTLTGIPDNLLNNLQYTFHDSSIERRHVLVILIYVMCSCHGSLHFGRPCFSAKSARIRAVLLLFVCLFIICTEPTLISIQYKLQ